MSAVPVSQRLAYWVPVLLYGGWIYYLSSLHGADLPEPFPGFDKLLHVALYFGLGLLTLRALACWSGLITRHTVVLAVLMAALYGVTDEWHQSYVPGRTTDGWDLCADILGALFGALAYVMLNQYLLRRMTCNTRSIAKNR